MRAMIFEGVSRPLRAVEQEVPEPAPGQLQLRVHACGICRTDLHLLDGEVEIAEPPRILGHQIIGTVERLGELLEDTAQARATVAASEAAAAFAPGDRVGVPWLGWSCGECKWC